MRVATNPARLLTKLTDLSSPLLIFGVFAYTWSLLWGRGTYEPALYICAAGVVLRLMNQPVRSGLLAPVSWTLVIGVLFLIPGMVMASKIIAGDFHWALASSLLAATAMALLPDKTCRRYGYQTLVILLLLLFVGFHIAGDLWRIQKNPVGKAGGFRNIHYMAQYAVMVMPVLVYLMIEVRGRIRWLLGITLLLAFWLLLQTHSRPGYLGLIASVIAVLPLSPGKTRWQSLSLFAAILLILYFSGGFGFSARINDFMAHAGQDERAAIWHEFIQMQARSTPLQWVFGHGLGQYFWDYQSVSSFHSLNKDFSSPHNYLLELLYTGGITGLILFIAAYWLWYRELILAINACTTPTRRRLGLVLVSITTAELFIGFFTIPFFSRHNLHPLSLILGASLLYIIQEREHARAG